MRRTNMYSDTDIKVFMNNTKKIKQSAKHARYLNMEPTMEQLKEINQVIRKFVIDNSRKIYGDIALQLLLDQESDTDNDSESQCDESWSQKITFYSPTPTDDAITISDILAEKGFKYTRAVETFGDNSYRIQSMATECAEITYLPESIYESMDSMTVNDMVVVDPMILTIGFLMMTTNPLDHYTEAMDQNQCKYSVLTKAFTNMCDLLKQYPVTKAIDTDISVEPIKSNDLQKINKAIQRYCTQETCIMVGGFACRYFLKESGMSTDNINLMPYEVISIHYKSDTHGIIKGLREAYGQKPDDPRDTGPITFMELYPYYKYLGHSTDIMFESKVICRVYHYNNNCIPYKSVPLESGTIGLGSFGVQIMFLLTNIQRFKTRNDPALVSLYQDLVNQMIEARKRFLDTGKDILSDTLFEEFFSQCVGSSVSGSMRRQQYFENKKYKKLRSWEYYPDKQRIFEPVLKNISGNPIKNDKNYKINMEQIPDKQGEIKGSTC